MRQETQDNLSRINEIFGGSNGGVDFVKFRWLIEEMDRQASEKDPAAIQIIEHLAQMRRLMDYSITLYDQQSK